MAAFIEVSGAGATHSCSNIMNVILKNREKKNLPVCKGPASVLLATEVVRVVSLISLFNFPGPDMAALLFMWPGSTT